MGGLASEEVLHYLEALGRACHEPARLYLIGGGALCLMGSPRRTADIDFSLTISKATQPLIDVMRSVADEMKIELEVITIEEFVPIPANASQRHRYVGDFGAITAYIYDPYTIVLSKLARGLESDIQDVLFLVEQNVIELDALEKLVDEAIPLAWEHDVDPADLRRHLSVVHQLFNGR